MLKKKKNRFDPKLDHLSHADFENVYEPAEDSFLFVDAIQSDLEKEKEEKENEHNKIKIVLEVGSGSGFVSAFVRNLLRERRKKNNNNMKGSSSDLFFTTDLNPLAASATFSTFEKNQNQKNKNHHQKTIVAVSDLASCFEKRLQGQVDILLFNPPYVPTEDSELFSVQNLLLSPQQQKEDEITSQVVSAAWAGGERGRRVIDRFLPRALALLRPLGGKMFMVVVRENDPAEIAHIAKSIVPNLQVSVIRERKVPGEHLQILKFLKL